VLRKGMVFRRYLGVSALAVFVGIVGCSSSDGAASSEPRIDLTSCPQQSTDDGTCSACCIKAGFNGSGLIGSDNHCACSMEVVDKKACAGQDILSNACASCCQKDYFSVGLGTQANDCICFGRLSAEVCASASECVQCCNDHGYLSSPFDPSRCLCSTI
jgi:hypothetical protein